MLYTFISACFLTSLISFFFSIFVFKKNPTDKTHCYWSLMCVAAAFWSAGLGFMAGASTKPLALFYLKYIHYMGAIFIPPFFLHFVLSLLNIQKKHYPILLFSYLCALIQQGLNLSGQLATVAPIGVFNFYTIPLPAYHFFTFTFFLIVIYSNYLVFKHYAVSPAPKKEQLKYLFLGMTIGFSGGGTAFFPVYHIPIFPFGLYFAFLYIPIISYAVIRHQLLGMDMFLKKGLIFLFILTFIVAPVFLICLAVTSYIQNPFLQTVLLFPTIILIGLLIPKLKIRGELKIENILFGNRFDYRKALRELHNAFVSKLELESLLETIVNTLSKALDLRETAIFIKQPDGSFSMASYSGPQCRARESIRIPKDSPFFDYLANHFSIVSAVQTRTFLEAYKREEELNFFKAINLKLLLPIRTSGGLTALLALGDMHTEFDFSPQDKDIFASLATEIGIAIENAMAYKQIKDLSINLDKKVSERTQELENTLNELKSAQTQIIRASKLASIGSLAAGIAHEINNALNATINSANNLNKFWNKLKHQETTIQELFPKMENAIEIIHRGMERTRGVVDHLLRFSRKNAEGFKPDKIHEGIESALELLSNEIRVRQIQVIKVFCDSREIFCNLSELNQVFFNMILNAIDAIDKNGCIQIKTFIQDGLFFISIKDNGHGIDSKVIDQIFDPFFSTKAVGKGTGLGLATSYQIVRDHGGQIEVKSKVGEGSEFIISIPAQWGRSQRKAG